MEQELPLQNTSIVVTRPEQQNHTICQQLSQLGATAIPFPCIEIDENPSINLENTLSHLSTCQVLIFISSNAVEHAFRLFPSLNKKIPDDCVVCAVGSATAKALHSHGIQQILVPSKQSSSEELLKLPSLQNVKHKLILIMKGVGGRELIYDTLVARDAKVYNVETYQRSLPKLVDITPLSNKIDLILFTSGETVGNFLALTSDSLQKSLLTCQTMVGHPRIAEKVTSLGFKKLPIIAATPSDADMLVAIQQWIQSNKPRI